MGVPSVEVLSNILITAGAKRIVKDLVSHFDRITKNVLYTYIDGRRLIFWTFRNLDSPHITSWTNRTLNGFKKKKSPWSCKWYDAEHLHRVCNYTRAIHTFYIHAFYWKYIYVEKSRPTKSRINIDCNSQNDPRFSMLHILFLFISTISWYIDCFSHY